jgi:hypothetical protein
MSNISKIIKKIIDQKILLFVLFLQVITTIKFLSYGLPSKKDLLIGEKYVGRISKKFDPSIPIFSEVGYDSQFYWAIALDPFIRNQEVINSLDSPSYRYQRIFFPFLVWLLSFGKIPLIVYNLYFICLLSYLLGLYAILKISKELSIPPFILVLLYIFNAGIVFSLIHPLADLLASSLVLFAFFLWLKNKFVLSAVVFTFAGLSKETTLLVPLSIILFNLLNSKKIFNKQSLILLLFIVIPILWQVFIRYKLGVWPFQQSYNCFNIPYFGIFEVFKKQGVSKNFFAAVCMILFYIYTIIKIRFPKNVLETIVYVQAIFLSFAGVAILEDVHSSFRASIIFFLFFSLWYCTTNIYKGSLYIVGRNF